VEEKRETAFLYGEDNVDTTAMSTILNYPNAIVSLSDGGAHVRFHGGYGYSTRLLGHWVREQHIMSLEQAVRCLTFESASTFGIYDRGLLRNALCQTSQTKCEASAPSGEGGKANVWAPPAQGTPWECAAVLCRLTLCSEHSILRVRRRCPVPPRLSACLFRWRARSMPTSTISSICHPIFCSPGGILRGRQAAHIENGAH